VKVESPEVPKLNLMKPKEEENNPFGNLFSPTPEPEPVKQPKVENVPFTSIDCLLDPNIGIDE